MRPYVLVAMVPVPAVMLVGALLWPVHHSFFLGVAVGSCMTLPFALDLAAPEHVDRWRRGADGEKRTAKALRGLAKKGWAVFHDVTAERSNFDHVVVAPSGELFLLDSKAPGGTVTVSGGVLAVSWLEDPDDGYEHDLTGRMKAAAAELSEVIRAAPGRRQWVTPVVVIWGRWDGPPHSHDGVAWVPGRVLAERLAANVREPDPRKHAQAVAALRAHAASSAA